MPFLFIYFRKMKKSDFGVIAVLYLVGIAFLVMTLKLPTGAMRYPLFLTVVFLALVSIYLIQQVLHYIKTREIVDDLKQKFQDFQAVQFFGVCAFCVIYLILIQKLGYYLSSVLFMLGDPDGHHLWCLYRLPQSPASCGTYFWLGPAEINQCKKL